MFRMNFSIVLLAPICRRQLIYYYFVVLISACFTIVYICLTAWLFICVLVDYFMRKRLRNYDALPTSEDSAQTGQSHKYFGYIKDAVFGVVFLAACLLTWWSLVDEQFRNAVFLNWYVGP